MLGESYFTEFLLLGVFGCCVQANYQSWNLILRISDYQISSCIARFDINKNKGVENIQEMFFKPSVLPRDAKLAFSTENDLVKQLQHSFFSVICITDRLGDKLMLNE